MSTIRSIKLISSMIYVIKNPKHFKPLCTMNKFFYFFSVQKWTETLMYDLNM